MNSKKMINCNSIGIYDKRDNLVGYAEFKGNKELKCYYSVKENILNRKYTNNYTDEPSETISSIIEYSSNIMLFPLCVGGETSIRTIQSGVTFNSLSSPPISSRIDVYDDSESNDAEIQCFSITSNLIDEWLNKV